MKKKFLSLLLIFISAITLSSCSLIKNMLVGPEEDVTLIADEVKFTSYSEEYTVKPRYVKLYYKENSHLPYVSISEFIDMLSGFLATDYITKRFEKGRYTVSWRSSVFNTNKMECYWEENKIVVNDYSFFFITEEQEQTNYNEHLKTSSTWEGASHGITLDLGKYNFDVIFKDTKCYIPLFIFNLLFCSINYYNIYYNGDELFGVDQFLNMVSSDLYTELKTSSLNGTDCPSDLREDTLNSIYFILDYFYGLKEYKDIESFEEYIPNETKEKILSENPDVFNDGYYDLFQKQLDELHTSIYIKSFYNDPSEGHGIFSHLGSFWEEYYNFSDYLEAESSKVFGDNIPSVRFYDDTAIINFTSFDTGTHDQIYNKNGTVKEDAWMYDSYCYFTKCLEEIGSQLNIKHVIVDVTQNGGGNLGALLRVLGFITNKDAEFAETIMMTGQDLAEFEKIDADADDDYDDDDAYTQYDWNILTSLNTFSAANYFTAICKSMGIARIIGEKSGGGMCSVLPVIIADGTSFRLSSPTQLKTIVYNGDKIGSLKEVESGIEPDIVVDHTNFYNDAYLDSVVSRA